MNLHKHMEAVFVATVALAISGIYVGDAIPPAHAQSYVTKASNGMTVVVVKAKRMTAEEKLKSVQAESALAGARDAAGRA